MRKLAQEAHATQQKLYDLALEWDEAYMIFLSSGNPELKRLALELDAIYGRYIYKIARKMGDRAYRRTKKAVEIKTAK